LSNEKEPIFADFKEVESDLSYEIDFADIK
jgi:hypothetical protein